MKEVGYETALEHRTSYGHWHSDHRICSCWNVPEVGFPEERNHLLHRQGQSPEEDHSLSGGVTGPDFIQHRLRKGKEGEPPKSFLYHTVHSQSLVAHSSQAGCVLRRCGRSSREECRADCRSGNQLKRS